MIQIKRTFPHAEIDPRVQMQIIASIGRAVWRNDIALFGKCNADWTFICTCVHLAPISGLTGTSYKVTIFAKDLAVDRVNHMQICMVLFHAMVFFGNVQYPMQIAWFYEHFVLL